MLPREVEKVLSEYLDLWRTHKRVEDRLKELQNEIVAYMEATGSRVLEHEPYQVTLIKATRDEVDAEGLYRALKEKGLLSRARRVFRLAVDRAELFRLVDRGLLDRTLVARYVKSKPVSPYLRVDHA